jgi:hypothetical protein
VLVRLVDVLPTILEAAGLDADPQPGRPLLDRAGADLEADPREQHDVAEAHPVLIGWARQVLAGYAASAKRRPRSPRRRASGCGACVTSSTERDQAAPLPPSVMPYLRNAPKKPCSWRP